MSLEQVYLLVELITALIGLIGTGVGAFFAVRNFFKVLQEKSTKEIWTTIMGLADAAISQAEKSAANGATKKQMVIDAVKSGCAAAGLDLDPFIDQLSAYIDQTVSFANSFHK